MRESKRKKRQCVFDGERRNERGKERVRANARGRKRVCDKKSTCMCEREKEREGHRLKDTERERASEKKRSRLCV